MPNFNFVNDDRFRKSLTEDYQELVTCIDQKCWKSVLILSGSIVEALLIDFIAYLNVSGGPSWESVPIEKMDLGNAISVLKAKNLLTDRIEKLSSVIQTYRNLIHPERIIRLREKVDERGARISRELVEMISDEIAETKGRNYGYTAEQIMAKIEKDFSARAILSHLIKPMNEREKERLLISVIPDRYFEIYREWQEEFETDAEERLEEKMDSLRMCYREGFKISETSTKKKVTEKYLSVLKEEGGWVVSVYEGNLFYASDIELLTNQEDVRLVIKHMLSRSRDAMTSQFLKGLVGIGKYVDEKETVDLVDLLVGVIVSSKTEKLVGAAEDGLVLGYTYMNDLIKEIVKKRLDVWIQRLKNNGSEADAEKIKKVKDSFAFF